ncbi:hypothetical protein BDQ12DRAFT_97430 [Crucibulum laeve]|uniref:Uncharacterized protein n=1 Tax=Crucibulum laeve TaxID=68775 RepID=A0A5C3M1M9_9AGAR|nr:hypothetical protein BDQ12DRAFT_97430 [Crucibulum laeve]
MPTGAPDSGFLNESNAEGNTIFFSPTSIIEPPNRAKSPMQRLEINDFDEDASFLQSFSNYVDNVTDNSLFIGQPKTRRIRGADTSYTIERFTDLKELDSQWEDDEVDEIVVMSPKPTMLSPSQKQSSQDFSSTKQSPLPAARLPFPLLLQHQLTLRSAAAPPLRLLSNATRTNP